MLAAVCGCGQEGTKHDEWTPPHVYNDAGYIEEVGEVVSHAIDARDAETGPDGFVWLATASGVLHWSGTGFEPVALADSGPAHEIAFDTDGRLACAIGDSVILGEQEIDLPAGTHPRFVGTRLSGGVWIAGDDIAGWYDGAFHPIGELAGVAVRAITSDESGRWYAATSQGVVTAQETYTTADGLPSDYVRSLAACPDGTIWAGTAQGLASLVPGASSWDAFLGEQGLHYGDIYRVSCNGSGDLYVATSKGGSIYRAGGKRRYYFGPNWTAGEVARAITEDERGDAWIAGPEGVARVRRIFTTLADKAALFDEITQARHVRLGYTSTENALREWGNPESFYNHDDDNDGQWTGMYLASQSFRYAVTGDEEARRNADRAAEALVMLERVTPVRGFFARSIVPGDECPGKQNGPGEWHLSQDGQWCWKGDTSSDEFVGHVFGMSIYHDLAADEQHRKMAASHLEAIVSYIADNGFKLLDIDGQPTTHGRFDPDFMENDLTAIYGDAGLNSAMILGGLLAAHHATGDGRFLDDFKYLARERNYADYIACIEEKNTAVQINHDSEEMSFLAMYTLLRYTEQPDLKQLWLHGSEELECGGLDYLWQVQRPERNPEFNVMYAALSHAERYDLNEAVETLQKLPRNLVLWGIDNSHRWDAVPAERPDRFGVAQNSFVFPYDELQALRWAENPYAFRMRGNGYSESSGTFWLLPYWMARYHGLIE
ncbi:MAG: hypothetical protein D6806_02330 [Deltaproteobacteria bacterium]|nr:MAG: hypothetical protein D6806_02330 [Deltaproteobacteria bacterium]